MLRGRPGQRPTLCGGCQPDPLTGRVLRRNVPRGEADANNQNSTAKQGWNPSTIDPDDAPRAVREYLEVLDGAAFGAATTGEPKFTSHSDPSSQWTAARKITREDPEDAREVARGIHCHLVHICRHERGQNEAI